MRPREYNTPVLMEVANVKFYIGTGEFTFITYTAGNLGKVTLERQPRCWKHWAPRLSRKHIPLRFLNTDAKENTEKIKIKNRVGK